MYFWFLIITDYSEGYENGETDCGVPPYDDTVYYSTPAEAVFTDPNTGQVYYGELIIVLLLADYFYAF